MLRSLFILCSMVLCLPAFAAEVSPQGTFYLKTTDVGGSRRNVTYQIFLDDSNPAFDKILELGLGDLWHDVHSGKIDRIYLPSNNTGVTFGKVTRRMGEATFIQHSGYYTSRERAGGIRFISEGHLMVHTGSGVLRLPYPGDKIDFRILAEGEDLEDRGKFSYIIVSVKGENAKGEIQSGTYLFYSEVLGKPGKAHLIDNKFRTEELGAMLLDDQLSIDDAGIKLELNLKTETYERRQQSEAGHQTQRRTKINPMVGGREILPPLDFGTPSEELRTRELIEMLDHRAELEKSPDAIALVTQAVRGMIVGHVPALKDLAAVQPKVKLAVDNAARAIGRLWLAGRLPDGRAIGKILTNRLEIDADFADPQSCELDLVAKANEGGHAPVHRREAEMNLRILRNALLKRARQLDPNFSRPL